MDPQSIWNRLQNEAQLLKAWQTDLQNENERLKNENRGLQERFLRFLLQQSFISLLQPGHSGKNLAELCQRLGIQKPNGSFLLLEFSNDAVLGRSDRIPQNPFSDPEMNQLLRAVEQTLGAAYSVIAAPYGDRILCLVQLEDEGAPETLKEYLLAQIAQLKTRIPEIKLYAAVSPVVCGVRNLPEAFNAVKQLTDYKSIMEENAPDVLFSEDFSTEAWVTPGSMVSDEQRQFVFLTRIGAFADAVEVAQAMCRQKLCAHPSLYNLPLAMAALKDTFIHTLGSACTELNMFDIYVELEVVQRIANAQTAQEVEARMTAVLGELAQAFSQTSCSDTLPQRMKSYIDENYRNPDLNVNAVANFFDISTAHATKIFRGQYNSTILDYIHKRRIFTAKEMLGSGQSISEIARYAGYGSSANMIRAFHRLEGITPGQLMTEKSRDS